MIVFATFDDSGFPTGFFREDWHGARMRPVFGPAPEPSEADPNPPAPIVGEEPNPDTTIPADAIAITADQHREFIENEGRRRWDGENVVLYDPPAPPAPPLPPIVIAADVLFFERMTDAEYDALDDSVRTGETARVYRGWSAAREFSEGTDMWALLVKHLTPDPDAGRTGVTAARRNELLARP